MVLGNQLGKQINITYMQNKELYTVDGQRFYISPGERGPVPTPEKGDVKILGSLRICRFQDSGVYMVSVADGSSLGLVLRFPDGTWKAYNRKKALIPGYFPTEEVRVAVTLAAKQEDPFAVDTSYSGHGPHQALQDQAHRMAESLNPMIAPLDKGAFETFQKGIEESIGIQVGNLEGVTKGTFVDAPASSATVDAETGDLLSHELAGVAVFQRKSDGYFNATALCKAAGKEWSGYIRTVATKEFMAELEGSLQIHRDPVVITITDGPNDGRGTWVHPDVAIHLAQWCSPRFAARVSRWVREWLTTGKKPETTFDLSDPESLLRHLQQASTLALEARESLRLEQQARVSVMEEKAQIEEAMVQVITTASETAGFMTIMDYAKDREKFLGYGQNDLCLLLRLLGIFFYRKFEYIKGRVADRNHVNGEWIKNGVFVYRKDDITVTPRSDKKAAAIVAATLALPESPADCYNEKDMIDILTQSIRVAGSKAHVLDKELFTDPLTLLRRRCKAEFEPRKRHPLREISDRWMIWDSPVISEAAKLAKHSLRILGEGRWTKAIRLWKTEVAGVTQTWTCWAFSSSGKQVLVTRPTESEALDALAVALKKTA